MTSVSSLVKPLHWVLCVCIYTIYILYRTSGLLVPQKRPNIKWCQHANVPVTGSLKFKGQVRKQLTILNTFQIRVCPHITTQALL